MSQTRRLPEKKPPRKERRLSKIAIFLGALMTSGICAGNVSGDELPLDVSADSVEYDAVSRTAFARGNVRITRGGDVVEADEVEIFIDKNVITASGRAKLMRGADDIALFFSSGTLDHARETSEFLEASGYFGSWIFTAGRMNSRGNRYKGAGASYTTCSEPRPHYRILSTRLTIVPRRFVSTTNAFFYLGSLPVFWLPYWWHSLGDGPLNVTVEPGYNNTDGAFARTRIAYKYSELARTHLLVDYYSLRGTGLGADSLHEFPGRHKSAVYLYRIDEKIPEKDGGGRRERWSARSYMWQNISERWSARSEINYYSDESFNESYFGESWHPVQREINSNLFFTRQSSVSHLSAGASQRQVYDAARLRYVNDRTAAPSVSYSRYRGAKYLGFYPVYSLGYERVSAGYEKPYLSRFNGSASADAQRQITADIAASPYLGIAGDYAEESEESGFSFLARYFAGSGLRWRWSRISFLDIRYRYARKFEPDSLVPDPAGLLENSLRTGIFVFPSRYLSWKVGGGYNFINSEPDSLANELNFSGGGHSLFVSMRHSIVRKAYESVLAAWSMGERVAFNVYHNDARPETVGLGASLSAPLDSKTAVSAQYIGNLESGAFMPLARQIKLERDLHCWEGWLLYRRRDSASREPVDEVYFNLALKFEKLPSGRKSEIEREFYPWRR